MSATDTRSVTIAVSGVFLGCCLNAVFLEYLVKADPGSGNLATFSQYLFVATEGFINTAKFGTAKRYIPVRKYLTIVATFFICNVLNNYVFDFNISMPLHMIFRSGSLITNMALCIIILKKKYSFRKFMSVGLITGGVFLCTLASGKQMASSDDGAKADASFFWWLIGVSILVLALIASSMLGIYQERLYAKYGKHPNEALFYTHLIPLPAFFMFANNIKVHLDMAIKSPALVIPILNLHIPETLFYLFGNVLAQYICIKSVYRLTTEASSLSCTLVLTLRKFISLLLSIVYFNNAFTFHHWVGTACVFWGTLIFTELI